MKSSWILTEELWSSKKFHPWTKMSAFSDKKCFSERFFCFLLYFTSIQLTTIIKTINIWHKHASTFDIPLRKTRKEIKKQNWTGILEGRQWSVWLPFTSSYKVLIVFGANVLTKFWPVFWWFHHSVSSWHQGFFTTMANNAEKCHWLVSKNSNNLIFVFGLSDKQ